MFSKLKTMLKPVKIKMTQISTKPDENKNVFVVPSDVNKFSNRVKFVSISLICITNLENDPL